MNIAEIETQLSDLVKQPFDASEFPFQLLEIYKAPKATLTKLRKGTQNKGERPGDVLWARKLSFRPAAKGEVAQTIDALKNTKATKSQKPRFLFATDGAEIAALDLKADETLHCDLAVLNDHFDFFLPLAGIDKYEAVKENPADIKATGRLAKFHDEIVRHNPGCTTDDKRHALNQFMTRILFCMFAEDTGSFPKDLFVKTITEFGGDDGEHLQSLLRQIFDVMNVPSKERRDIPAHISAFPYVNGGLFAESSDVPAFNRRARRILIEAAQLDWREINPDIFGSMIQAIVHPDMRGDLGMHYTSVPNIMKVLQPLFLMSLEEEVAEAYGHREERSRLTKLLARISKIRVFDPACGSGNFLIIAYRELRTLEMRVFKRLEELDEGQRAHRWTGVKLSNFYGIELADFAAETAKLSLWIAEYQMNQRFKDMFGEAPPNFPLTDGGHIVCGNALRLDWLEVCPIPKKTVQKQKVFDLATVVPVHATEELIDDEVETFIVGNPPYQGRAQQTKKQKADIAHVFSAETKRFKKLDYVACWILKAADYCSRLKGECALVATNSICQGEQVSLLWPLIFSHGIEIGFAHQSFKWANNASRNAAVICVIVGIRPVSKAPKVLFDDELARRVKNISPYLIDGETIIVRPISNAASSHPMMRFGNMPADGGNLILSPSARAQLLDAYPAARPLLKRLYGSKEFINGLERWCLWITDDLLSLARSIPPVAERIEKTKQMRLNSEDSGTQSLAARPHQFREMHASKEHAIVMPSASSERRRYLPCGIIDSDCVVTNLAFAIYDGPPLIFAILSTRCHAVWTKAVGGQLKSDYRYSNTLVYNTFPFPPLSESSQRDLDASAWDIIAAREAHPGKSLAWLYDPDKMPENLLDAHSALDDILEKMYIGRPFKNDTERLEHLFKLYAEMTTERAKEVANA
ncbi:class I SAM-dependent DNA methyltransferase [Bradyrhizobium ottawaense]